MVSSLVAGRAMVAIAGIGLLVSLLGGTIAWQLIADLDRGVGQSLELTGQVLGTVDDSFGVAEEALEVLDEGALEAEGAVRSLARSMEEGQGALDAATRLTGGDVADALESIERSLPAIQSAANTIDDTLRVLSSLPIGLTYDPARPLGDTIADLREELVGLPDALREQAEQVERTTDELTAATQGTAATADSLAELRERLGEARQLIGEYSLQTGEASLLVEEQREILASSAARARLMIVVVALAFAASQFVPLYLGLGLLGVGGPVGREPSA